MMPSGSGNTILPFNHAVFVADRGRILKSTNFGADWNPVFDVREIDAELAGSYTKSRLMAVREGILLVFEIPYRKGVNFLSTDGVKWRRMPDGYIPVISVQASGMPGAVDLNDADSVPCRIDNYVESEDSIFAVAEVVEVDLIVRCAVLKKGREMHDERMPSGHWSCSLCDSSIDRLCGGLVPSPVKIAGDNYPLLLHDRESDMILLYGNERNIFIYKNGSWERMPGLDIPVELHPPVLVGNTLVGVAEDGGIWTLEIGIE